MSDIATAPATPGTPVVPATPEPPKSLAEANKAVRAMGDSWENVALAPPSDGMGVTDGAEDDAPATPTPATDAAAPSTDATGEPEFVQDDTGRWHRADGTMANAEEIAQITAQLASETPAAQAAEEPAKENVVTLRRRDGSTREVVIDDPELAQEISQNFNDGMRRKEFLEKSAALDAQLARFNRLDALLTQNPESVVRESLTREQKINLGVMLLAEHFDDLIPAINEYNTDPGARIRATADASLRMKQQSQEFESFTTAQNAAADVRKAVAALIPEDAAQEIAEAFWADASSDVQRAMSRGEPVNPSTVSALLANRLKLYGFVGSAAPAADSRPRVTAKASPSVAASGIAQPANDAAKQLADAKAVQKRIRLRQQQRINAAAVPPAGAGAAPVRMPAVPAGANVQEASKQLRKLGSGWASVGNH